MSSSFDRQSRPGIHCVFEKDTDAVKVANTVRDDHVVQYPGWASQRTLRLDAEAGG
jgi:hypothetical protein